MIGTFIAIRGIARKSWLVALYMTLIMVFVGVFLHYSLPVDTDFIVGFPIWTAVFLIIGTYYAKINIKILLMSWVTAFLIDSIIIYLFHTQADITIPYITGFEMLLYGLL